MSKTYSIVCSDGSGPMEEVVVDDGYMMVYDICKIKDYEGGDYVPRAAKKMDHVVLPIGNPQFPESDPGDD